MLAPQYPRIRIAPGIFSIFFSYFASLDVLFSVWIFDVLFIGEGGWLSQLGYKTMSPNVYRGVYRWQTRGAFVVMVTSMFWVTRRHLRDVVLKALGKDDRVDDREELMSYRSALIGFLGGMAYLYFFVLRMGFDPIQGAMLLLSMVFCYVGMAKILSDTGMPYTQIPLAPWGLISPFLGNRGIDPNTQVSIRFANLIAGDGKGLFLPALAQTGRIAEGVPGNRRRLMWALSLAFVASFSVSVWLTLNLGYQHGAVEFNVGEVLNNARNNFKNAASEY